MPGKRSKMVWLNAVPALICAALAAYWAWTYRGVYQWLAELALRSWGKYDPAFTFFLTLVALLVPIILAQALLTRAMSRAFPKAFGWASEPGASPQLKSPSKPLGAPGLAILLILIIGGIGVALAVVGIYEFRRGRSAGPRVGVDAADLEAGKQPPGAWLAVSGKALQNAALGVKEGSASPSFYIPVISPAWKPGGGVGVYLESSQTNIVASNIGQRMVPRFGQPGVEPPEVWEGMLSDQTLPGLVRTRFEQTQLKPAAKYVIVEWGKTPSKLITDGRDMMFGGGIVAAFGLLVGGTVALIGRFRRRPEPEQLPYTGAVIDR